MHWTNGGATPYDIYQNIMDGAHAQADRHRVASAGNYGRFNSPEATDGAEGVRQRQPTTRPVPPR